VDHVFDLGSYAFEVVLDRTMQQVQKGRERLEVHAPAVEAQLDDLDDEGAFFDQDEGGDPGNTL